MKDIKSILELIQARADHHFSCALTAENEKDWSTERPLCEARAKALNALASEIRASIRSKSVHPVGQASSRVRWHWVLATEMGGLMNLTFYDDEVSAIKAKDQFCSDYKLKEDWDAHAVCEIREVGVPARRSGLGRGLDGRFALMVKVDRRVDVSIHETLNDLRSAIAEVEQFYDPDDIWVSYHAILVPRWKDPRGIENGILN